MKGSWATVCLLRSLLAVLSSALETLSESDETQFDLEQQTSVALTNNLNKEPIRISWHLDYWTTWRFCLFKGWYSIIVPGSGSVTVFVSLQREDMNVCVCWIVSSLWIVNRSNRFILWLDNHALTSWWHHSHCSSWICSDEVSQTAALRSWKAAINKRLLPDWLSNKPWQTWQRRARASNSGRSTAYLSTRVLAQPLQLWQQPIRGLDLQTAFVTRC